MKSLLSLYSSLMLVLVSSPIARTQNQPADAAADAKPEMLTYVAPKNIEMLIGVKVKAGNSNMVGTKALTVFPTEWPEQKVEVVAVNVPRPFTYSLRELPGNNKQLVLQARGAIPANYEVEATIQVRIEKKHTVGPDDPTTLTVPRRLPREAKIFMGNSPYIETTSAEVKRIVREILAEEPLTEWNKIEMFYDWVRENIQYENGDLKSVRQALRDRTGDCEEMTSTFVALCRAARVPARCVWIPNHCYAEFYMQDKEGKGYWFPCQLAGTRAFGSMPEYLPILQKGDRFKVPEKKQLERYLADHLSADRVSGTVDPKVTFIRQLLGDAAKLPAPDQNGAANPNAAAPAAGGFNN
ncbi:MAG: transglutaminase-like domain-containing protein [Planctomycetota bacterium]|nr:transglutaminase-like domain-containing protein [Planctomycetota bacterium]